MSVRFAKRFVRGICGHARTPFCFHARCDHTEKGKPSGDAPPFLFPRAVRTYSLSTKMYIPLLYRKVKNPLAGFAGFAGFLREKFPGAVQKFFSLPRGKAKKKFWWGPGKLFSQNPANPANPARGFYCLPCEREVGWVGRACVWGRGVLRRTVRRVERRVRHAVRVGAGELFHARHHRRCGHVLERPARVPLVQRETDAPADRLESGRDAPGGGPSRSCLREARAGGGEVQVHVRPRIWPVDRVSSDRRARRPSLFAVCGPQLERLVVAVDP